MVRKTAVTGPTVGVDGITQCQYRPGLGVGCRGNEKGREEGLERETGVEPATSSLGSLRSTPELLPLRSLEVDAPNSWSRATGSRQNPPNLLLT